MMMQAHSVAVLEARRPARERIQASFEMRCSTTNRTLPLVQAITGHVFRERLTPFINARVPMCRGKCKPCFSLVRRYLCPLQPLPCPPA